LDDAEVVTLIERVLQGDMAAARVLDACDFDEATEHLQFSLGAAGVVSVLQRVLSGALSDEDGYTWARLMMHYLRCVDYDGPCEDQVIEGLHFLLNIYEDPEITDRSWGEPILNALELCRGLHAG
jgi:hypothetical protein